MLRVAASMGVVGRFRYDEFGHGDAEERALSSCVMPNAEHRTA